MSVKKRTKVYDIKEANGWYDDTPLILSQDSPFTTGQIYTNTRAAKYVCRDCGTDKLYVGADDYLTVVMCPSCGWEEIVHDG